MKNNDIKKSTQLWVRRLFQQSGVTVNATQSKHFFTRRYHDHNKALAQNPFASLFSDKDCEESDQGINKTRLLSSIEDEALISGKPFQAMGGIQKIASDSLLAIDDDSYLRSSPTKSTQYQYKVLNCYDETLDTKTFRLGRLDGQHVDYLPGQYVTLSVVIAGQEYKRSYSLASSPSHHGIIEITVKRDSNGGVVSNWLNDHLKIDDRVNLKGPFGSFSCAKNSPQKIVFLAAGSGIVPIMSMLRWLADTEARVEVRLLLSFRNQYDIIFHDELNLIAARHSNIKLFITLTKELPEFIYPRQFLGRINQNMIAALVPDLTECAVYLCGPSLFMADCKIYLEQLQLPFEQLFCESFTVNSPVSSIPDSIIQRVRERTGSYQIRFAKSDKTISADGAATILELAEQSGINIGHECRSGNCGECMVKCLQGHVEMTEQAEIDAIDRKKGWIYSCCAYPTSNLVLDI